MVALLAAITPAMPVVAQVGLSIQIGQPNVYGPIQSGFYGRNQPFFTAPQFYYPRLRCHAFNGCSRPVYSVRDQWYRTNNIPRLRPERRWKQDNDNRSRRQQFRYRNNKRGWY
ncbi:MULTISPECIES: hypothetical protein [unclassified Synechococcus]|uniref:hypothetical protein n=1 Tax=unclassified Synechococcus TaxID=2626047 RepID=UPI0011A1F0EE|nr:MULTISPECIES: hypothetical protein [unclassified Synechococcus]MCT0201224.1 hypothetical protein [Synechococcus sp. CS-603]MCT4365848.1 hypothetical protein [Candidatus Regnicoccus frigidus MAG-AL1]